MTPPSSRSHKFALASLPLSWLWLPLWLWALALAGRVRKVLLRLCTGRSELQRICMENGGWHSPAMSLAFSLSLYRSRQLQQLSSVVFAGKPFSVPAAKDEIVRRKRMFHLTPTELIAVRNVSHCLHSISFANKCASSLHELRRAAFDAGAPSHVALLESLWSCLRPGTSRRPYKAEASGSGKESNSNSTRASLASADWGEVGFQGSDPATDFRGMGLLGLVQLEHLARTRPAEARNMLLNANHPRRYYPFAATGINVSAFVMELVTQRRVHGALYRALEAGALLHVVDECDGPCENGALVDIGVRTIHDVYCEVFQLFDATWTLRDPQDVMQFPVVFEEVKAEARSRYASIE